VMQPHTVAFGGGSNVDHGMDVVGNGDLDGSFHQSEEGLLEV
jgi:hypothetical protein